jgi:hypothetical protein
VLLDTLIRVSEVLVQHLQVRAIVATALPQWDQVIEHGIVVDRQTARVARVDRLG